MPKALCIACSNDERGDVEFPTVRELHEHQKAGHPVPPLKKEEVPSVPQPTPQVQPVVSESAHPMKKEIVLMYKYDGICTSCSRELDTIKVEMGDTYMMIAYCPNCKVQYKQIKVMPIEKQFKDEKQTERKKN